jgi:hypothetical protein
MGVGVQAGRKALVYGEFFKVYEAYEDYEIERWVC